MPIPSVSYPSGFSDELRDALRDWHAPSPESHPWQKLAIFTPGSSLRTALNRVLLTGLDALAAEDPQAAQVLRLRFADEITAQGVAVRLNVAEGTVYKWQRDALERLAESLWRLECEAQAGQQQALTSHLPPATYTRLFGIDAHMNSLRSLLLAPDAPWLVAVESLGGMGKTALADGFCRKLIREGTVSALAWVTAQKQQMGLGGAIQSIDQPALTSAELIQSLAQQLLADEPDYPMLPLARKEERLAQHFKTTPHLVVVDNLETLIDVEALLGHLRAWANPTKFLLTTRHSLLAEADIHHFSLPELTQADALALVRHEARLRNLAGVADAAESELNPIYDSVGGNPLALRLVVGQMHIYPLSTVLANLRRAQGSAATGLYTHIYQQAWQTLDEEARRILLAMPLVNPEGGDIDLLAAITDLPAGSLLGGLEQLVSRNLVDARGDMHQRRYSIHSLTRTFLHEQVLQWG